MKNEQDEANLKGPGRRIENGAASAEGHVGCDHSGAGGDGTHGQ